jgi:outer membrane protein OmpA-like peptidoglycan-associated protein
MAMLGVLMALAACSPVETWRDLTGASKNDPDPEATPNTQNLAAGEAAAYPNLATVPPPPTRALTTAEREQLTQSLIADRTNAKYTDEKLRAGFSAISAPVPPPPPPVPPAAAAGELAKPGDKTAAAAQGPGPRKAGEPPEPGPKESSLEAPQPRAVSTPEQTRLPPPASAAAHGSPAPGAAPLPAEIGTAKFQPPPPPPSLTQPPAAGRAAAPEKRPEPPAAPLAQVKFAGSSTALPNGEEADLAKVVASYQQRPGKIRVVGYAGGGAGAAEQLASYRVALDRAQAVAAALAKAGIPSDKILAEVAPAATDSGEGRAEVLLEH